MKLKKLFATLLCSILLLTGINIPFLKTKAESVKDNYVDNGLKFSSSDYTATLGKDKYVLDFSEFISVN